MEDKKINIIRQEIDKIDHQLLELFNRRAKLVVDLAEIKKSLNLKLFDPEREQYIFKTMTKKNQGPLTREAIIRIYERIIDESRRLERIEVYNRKSE